MRPSWLTPAPAKVQTLYTYLPFLGVIVSQLKKGRFNVRLDSVELVGKDPS